MHRATLPALFVVGLALIGVATTGTARAQQPQQPPPDPNAPRWQPPPDSPPPQQAPPPQTGPHQAPAPQTGPHQAPPPQAGPHQAPPAPGGPHVAPPAQGALQQAPPQQHVASPPPGQTPPGPNAAPLAAPVSPQDQVGPQAPVTPQTQVAPTPPTPPAPHIPLPVVVVAWPDRNVATPVNDAIRTAVVETLAPAARGRPTVALADPARLPPVLACNADMACIGAKLAELQAVAGVLVHVTRRNRTAAIDVRVELVDPVSGAPRHEPVTGQVPYAQEASPAAAVAALLQPLLASMPAPPPPPPTLLVAVNVDGAHIMVDGQPFAESPAPPNEVTPGRHNVVVSHGGWATGNRMVNVADIGATRADFDLDPSADTLAEIETGRVHDTGGGRSSGGNGHEQPWYTQWYVIGGAAVVLTAIIVIVVAVAASGTDIGPPNGIPVPGIH